jgi:hypothetical protein
VPLREVARAAAEQVEALVESASIASGGRSFVRRRGELDRERQAVEAPADLLDRRPRSRPSA